MGVGFDFGIAAIKAGIEGIVSLAEISLPAHAGVGIAFDAVEDDRELPPETLSLFDGGLDIAFNVAPKKLQLKFIYDFGINLAFTDILSGQINLKLKLKFLFFSKTWKKTIAKWTGFCPSHGDREDWCDIPLFNYAGELETSLSIPWATIKLNVAFPNFPEIPKSEFYVPGVGEDPELTEIPLDKTESENFRWSMQCGEPIV